MSIQNKKSAKENKGSNIESNDEQNNDKDPKKDEKKFGENGPVIMSDTVKQRGKTERVDIENQVPGKADGNIHYHEPNNNWWYYDVKTGRLFKNNKNAERIYAPPKVQKVTNEKWFKDAIEKALEKLGEK